jgi:hypothetical protein
MHKNQEVKTMNQVVKLSVSRPVECRWLSGAQDKVCVSDLGILQDVILEYGDFLEIANRDAINALQRQGLAQLECDQTQWDVIAAHKISVWNDSALFL